ncbi:MAG: DUF3800 domain-containing protein [Alphaproteobacteria bacterium]|nr:DUF3800 domain-containing protein [Alphaproteobacteria bacterium]
MYLCYVDESGTSDLPGNTSHFVLAGIAMPIWHWKDADREVETVLKRYDLHEEELHTAWLVRRYVEQGKIENFEALDRVSRRSAVERYRVGELLRLQKKGDSKAYKQAKKNYKHTAAYVHLTEAERVKVVEEIASVVSNWGFARLFAECIDKTHFDQAKARRTVDEQAFEQVISRFEKYLSRTPQLDGRQNFGIVVHDNNDTTARKHTTLMRRFHTEGTLWTDVDHIIETPMFVDSRLTRMVQVADLCSYALRRFVENSETTLFRKIFARADRVGARAVGARHFTALSCACEICESHRIKV